MEIIWHCSWQRSLLSSYWTCTHPAYSNQLLKQHVLTSVPKNHLLKWYWEARREVSLFSIPSYLHCPRLCWTMENAPAQHRGEGERQAALNKTHQGCGPTALWGPSKWGLLSPEHIPTLAFPALWHLWHHHLEMHVESIYKAAQLNKDWNLEWGPVQMDESGGRTQLNKTACKVWLFTMYFHCIGLKAEV